MFQNSDARAPERKTRTNQLLIVKVSYSNTWWPWRLPNTPVATFSWSYQSNRSQLMSSYVLKTSVLGPESAQGWSTCGILSMCCPVTVSVCVCETTSLWACWSGRRPWALGPVWCSWSPWGGPPSAAAGPVHRSPDTGTPRRSPDNLQPQSSQQSAHGVLWERFHYSVIIISRHQRFLYWLYLIVWLVLPYLTVVCFLFWWSCF